MSNTTTKADLVDSVAKDAGIKKVEAERAIASFMESVKDSLADGRKVTLVGFGTFELVDLKSRRGTDPRTRKPITIPGRTAVRFRPGKAFREVVG